MKEKEFIIKTKLSNGAELHARVMEGRAIFTCSDKNLLWKLYLAEKNKFPNDVVWHDSPTSISRLYDGKTAEEIKDILNEEIRRSR